MRFRLRSIGTLVDSNADLPSVGFCELTESWVDTDNSLPDGIDAFDTRGWDVRELCVSTFLFVEDIGTWVLVTLAQTSFCFPIPNILFTILSLATALGVEFANGVLLLKNSVWRRPDDVSFPFLLTDDIFPTLFGLLKLGFFQVSTRTGLDGLDKEFERFSALFRDFCQILVPIGAFWLIRLFTRYCALLGSRSSCTMLFDNRSDSTFFMELRSLALASCIFWFMSWDRSKYRRRQSISSKLLTFLFSKSVGGVSSTFWRCVAPK